MVERSSHYGFPLVRPMVSDAILQWVVPAPITPSDELWLFSLEADAYHLRRAQLRMIHFTNPKCSTQRNRYTEVRPNWRREDAKALDLRVFFIVFTVAFAWIKDSCLKTGRNSEKMHHQGLEREPEATEGCLACSWF